VPNDLASIDNYTLFCLDRNPKQKRKGGGFFTLEVTLSVVLLNIVISVSLISSTCILVVSLPQLHIL